MKRGLSLLEPDASGVLTAVEISAVLGVARCGHCDRRIRVLPTDILPRKHYGLSVIEHVMAVYAEGSKGLRPVAWSLAGERTPAFTTLHAWTEGLGAHALGREAALATPHTALVAETEARMPVARNVAAPVVDERRARSEGRRDRLGAVTCLLAVAVVATGVAAPFALASWCALALGWGLTSPLLFRTGLPSTRPEHAHARLRARSPPT